MEYGKAYVFQPSDIRPAKRRRVDTQGLQASWRRRREAYTKAWQAQQRAIDERLSSINAATVSEVSAFLDEAISSPQSERIPTGVILAGYGVNSHSSIVSQLARRKSADEDGRQIYVTLTSAYGANLKALLKSLIQRALRRQTGLDDDEEDPPTATARRGPRLLNYDLQLLHDYVREHKLQQIVVAFEDTEAFDSDLLSELIEMLGCWHGRIPFAFLFNIATSIDFLQQRLARAAIKCLDGRLFDLAPAGEAVEAVFDALMSSGAPLWLGPSVMSILLERQGDYIQSIDGFVDAVRYAYMSAYYANASTQCLESSENLPDDHCEALRNLESFRAYAQQMLENKELLRLKDCLESNQSLAAVTSLRITEGQRKLNDMMSALSTLRKIQEVLPNMSVSPRSSLYVQAMSGKLHGSTLLRMLLLTIRKMPSHVTVRLLEAILAADSLDTYAQGVCRQLLGELNEILGSRNDPTQPLRSEDDVQNSTLRTTVVAQKVELSKHKAALSDQDKAYTQVLGRLSEVLESYFEETLVNPKDLPFHEVFVYDLKSPHREVFMPRPRHAIERALASPHDYLDCECCEPDRGERDEATLSATQPATAVLYQLYLESGSLINASDLWQAFQAVIGDERDESQTMAHFQRALAELKYLGFVKQTRKRVDHIAKVMWRGL
ncbi:hypothetical protein BAUCODRAFT_140424 [Baudoinia panamericana UAMH 10762]|uniref:Uncharacterized protein n=1 Tax=Baudoinia panamericana (strain UAMH 10762) TaxID=717646 RepID=M2MF45_BAUPA|nr:uncharacterized protein BAUCODRAFT_140424 [Baudoinia panamericana UAMH 10762]EMC95246.1 hypothetical protein BAUCODRAFT_140424 [Baudoinia panamericana UAMH 10762]